MTEYGEGVLLVFRVDGKPETQGHKIAAVTKDGKPYVREAGGRDWENWRTAIAWAAKLAHRGRAPLEGPVGVAMAFTLAPGRHKAAAGSWAAQWPDADTLCRAVLDGITTAGCWKDDKQVCELIIRKFWAAPGDALGVLVRVYNI